MAEALMDSVSEKVQDVWTALLTSAQQEDPDIIIEEADGDVQDNQR